MDKWRGVIMIMIAWLFLSQYTPSGDKGRYRQMMFELSKAAPEARVRTNPYEGNQDACRAGWKLFQRHCSVCHGKDAKGGNDAPDLQSPPIRDAAPGTLFWFLKNGDLKKGMPSWARLPEQQLWQIVSYLKSKN